MNSRLSIYFAFFLSFCCLNFNASAQTLLNQQSKLTYGYWSMAQSGNYLVGSRYGVQKLDVYDVSDPNNVLLIAQKALPVQVSVICYYQNRYILAGSFQKLSVWDLNNVATPTKIAEIPLDGDVKGISCANKTAFISEDLGSNNYKLQQIDLSTIQLPTATSNSSFTSPISPLVMDGGKAFLLEKKQSSSTLYAYNVSNSGVIALISITTLPVSLFMDAKDNMVFVATPTKVLQYDASSLTSITKIAEKTITTPYGIIAIDGNHYATTHGSSIKTVDVLAGTTETFTSNFQALSLASFNGVLTYSTIGGTYLLESKITTDIDDSDFSSEISVYPNPSTDYWIFKTNKPVKGVLMLWDYQGQQLQKLTVDTSEPIIIENAYPKGMYLYTIDTEDGKYTSGWLMSEK